MTETAQPLPSDEKKYDALTITTIPGSQVEIVAEIPVTVAHHYRLKALKKVQQSLELPGFRKGHVPEDMVLKHVGDAGLMQEVAEAALADAYPQIVSDKALDVVGRPQVTITKLAPGNPIGFKIVTAVYPEVSLPDYKKIAAGIMKKADDPEKVVVTDEELDAELMRLRTMFAQPTPADASGEAAAGEEDGDKVLPELDDEFATKLGAFTGLDDLKEKMKAQMLVDKKQKLSERVRLSLADAVIEKSKLDVPDVFVEGELDQMVASFEDRVTRAGMELDEYLKGANKELDDLRKEWQPDALKRAKLQLIFNEIAKNEALAPNQERLEREVNHIHEHYPDANKHSVAVYVAAQMTNDMVFRLLEGKDPKVVPEQHHDHDHSHADDAETK